MDKKNLIKISQELRNKKDASKKLVEGGNRLKVPRRRIVIPRQTFEPSLELQSDKWLFNGFVIDLEGKLIVVDPGVDFYSRFTASNLSILDVGALILSHEHIDHSASISLFIEKILRNKSEKIDLFIPLVSFNNVVSSYHRREVQKAKNANLVLLKDKGKNFSYKVLDNYKIEFLPLFHSAPDSFGFKIDLKDSKIGYLSDTGYSIKVKTANGIFNPEAMRDNFLSIVKKHIYIKNFFSDVEIAIVNINDLHFNRHSKYHLSGWDVLDIFKDSALKRLVLQHLSPVNAEGEDSNYIYKLFFDGEPYETILPHFVGREISL